MNLSIFKSTFVLSLLILMQTSVSPAQTGSSTVRPICPKEIMLIHGMFMTPASWAGWIQKFEADGYCVTAPAWPLHDLPVHQQQSKSHLKELGQLQLGQVLEFYREILWGKSVKPILIGHSMGGLVAQILLSEGLGSAAIVLDSAPPKGIFVFSWSFLRSNWPALNPFARIDKPIEMNSSAFSYAFTNQQSAENQQKIFEEFYVPESRRVGRGPLGSAGKVDFKKARGPLLIIAGENDHIIPARLSFENFKAYQNTPGYTEFRMFPGRDHSLAISPGWEQVYDFSKKWLDGQFQDLASDLSRANTEK